MTAKVVRVDEEAFLLGQCQVLLAGQRPQLERDDDFAFVEGAGCIDPASIETAFSEVDIRHPRQDRRRRSESRLTPTSSHYPGVPGRALQSVPLGMADSLQHEP